MKFIMTITEKFPHANPNEIRLYKEGIFWVAYEQSAYYVWQKKGYKATKKMIKTLGKEIVSVGFPPSSYKTFKHTINTVLEKDEEYFKVFSLDKAIDMEAFQRWKDNLPLTPSKGGGDERNNLYSESPSQMAGICLYTPSPPPLEGVGGRLENEIFYKLYDFPLENKTPMECMVFLSEIKKICYSHGNL